MIRLFKVSIPSNVIALVISEAILVLCCYVLAAYWATDAAVDVFLFDDGGIWHIAFIAVVILLGIYFHDLYENYRIRTRTLLIQQFCMILGIAFLLQALANYGHWNAVLLPKWVMVYGSLMVLIVLPTWRVLFTSFVSKAMSAQRLLFLGSSAVVREIIARVSERAELGLCAIGYLDDGAAFPVGGDNVHAAAGDLPGAPRLGTIEDLDDVVATQVPERINRRHDRAAATAAGGPPARTALLGHSHRRCREQLLRRSSAGFPRDLRPSQLIFSTELGPSRSSMALQTLYSLRQRDRDRGDAAGDDGGRVDREIHVTGSRVVSPASRGAEWRAVHALQVSLHAP